MRLAKKYFKRIILISIIFLIAISLSLNFITEYSIKSVLKEVVRRETDGMYQLDFSKISVNLIKGRVMIDRADLKPADTSQSKTNYRLKIKDLYFSLGSWKQLLLNRTLLVDSIQINHPDIRIFHSLEHVNKNAVLQIQEIYASLNNIKEKFKVHVLEINNGDIGIYNQGAIDSPLLITNIYFRVENFGEKNNEKTKLRFSDDVVLNTVGQRWLFPSGQSLSFKKLYFSGRDQFFQLDSCLLTDTVRNAGQNSSLYADRLLFRVDELSSIFERNELNIDTLYCKSPVLSFNLPGRQPVKDSAGGLHQLLGNIHMQYTNIENGQIRVNSAGGERSYASQKADLKIYALDINNDQLPHIRADSIDLNLNEVTFTSRDSLYLLTIKEFELDGNNLVCKNAFLKPSPKNQGSQLSINLPEFTLVDVSLQDLLEKRLKARYVMIDGPQVYFTSVTKKKKTIEQGALLDRFYDALSELTQLIDVNWLAVKNGKFEYELASTNAFKLVINNINTEIDLYDLLKSASPMATKLSIRALGIESAHLHSGGTDIVLENFLLNGNRQIGKLKSLSIGLPSGVRLSVGNIYWEKFSWGDFLKDGRIDIDTLDIGKLTCTAGFRDDDTTNKIGMVPRVAITKLNIREASIHVGKRKNNSVFTAKASSLSAGQLTFIDSHFTWRDLAVKLEDISFRDEIKRVTVQRMRFSANDESQAENIVYRDFKNLVRIPQIKAQLNINRSDFTGLFLPYLSIYQPEITIGNSPAGLDTAKKNTLIGIMPFHIQKLDVTDGRFRYGFAGKQGFISGHVYVKIESAGKDEKNGGAILFDQASLNLDSVSVNTEKFPVTLDKLDLDIRKGSFSGFDEKKPMFTGLLNGQWKSLTLNKPTKNGFIGIHDLSGRVEDLPLVLADRSRNQFLESVINGVSLTKGNLFYSDSSITATVSNISGAGKEGLLELNDIEIKPKGSLDSFYRTSEWQKDYLTFHCDRIVLNKINRHTLLQDTAFAIQHVYLQSPRLSAYRDKNIPFQHGIEKLMPSKLIAKIKIPVRVDSIFIKEASIDVHEISVITKREGVIPLRNLEALIRNFTNHPAEKDSLRVDVLARVLDYDIKKFGYSESYHDSLSGFKMNYAFSPMALPALTEVSAPLSAIAVTSGYADTLHAELLGNKYAAFGDMNFFYDNLRIQVLNKGDPLKKSLSLDVENLLANSLLIRSNNSRPSRMFFIRDQEKFVFNYWVKTLFSGLLTSTGVRRNAQYQKMEDKVAEKYSLSAVKE